MIAIDGFNTVYDDDDETTLVSEETFHHEEEGLKFDYRIAIKREANAYLTGDEDDESETVSVYMVPEFSSHCKESRESALETFGCEPDTADLIRDGSCVLFDNVVQDSFDEAVGQIREDAGKLHAYNGLFGFYMDRAWNSIGTTGWDMARHLVNGDPLFK